MAPLYVVQPSANRGEGIFAQEDLKPGTIIMTDRVTCEIKKDVPDIDEMDVAKAFQKLNPADQELFMGLHESHRPLKTKLFRIYKANAFQGEHSSHIFLKISKFNHSCVPNCEVENSGTLARKVIATTLIKKGEEIFISYHGAFEGYTKAQRRVVTKTYFGFECDCSACTLGPEEQYLSDWRRKLIFVLQWRLKGLNPPDLRPLEALATMTAEEAEAKKVRQGWRAWPMERALTEQEKTAYWSLQASLLEAEGLIGLMAPGSCYAQAFFLLVGQASKSKVMLRPTLDLAQCWKLRALDLLASVNCGARSGEFAEWEKTLQDLWRKTGMQRSVQMFKTPLAKGTFAVQIREHQGIPVCEVFGEEEYKDKVRKGALPACMVS